MADWSVISQSPQIRALVQDNGLQRAFHDALFPAMLFRQEASPIFWPANVGDNQVFTGRGLLAPDMAPMQPGLDPIPDTWTSEQWTAQAQKWVKTIDTYMPNSVVAIANLFYSNVQQLGLAAAQTANRLTRNKLFSAALSGVTQSTAATNGGNTIAVRSLNGFTRARNPTAALGSPVQFQTVSANNPLPVRIMQSNGSEVTRNVTGYASTAYTLRGQQVTNDEQGPGVLTFDGAPITTLIRGYVIAVDASYLWRVGGGLVNDGITTANRLTLADIRAAVARLRNMNVPTHPDGYYHCHLDPTSESEIFADAEFQRLNTASLGEHFMYRQFALGVVLGCIFFRNNESPQPTSVLNGLIASPVYNPNDPFVGDLYATGINTGAQLHYAIFTGGDACKEYYLDMSGMITEAGLLGKIGEYTGHLTNNGIDIMADRIDLILRPPLDRLGEKVASTYRMAGDFVCRTDCATGDAARFKRTCAIVHG